MATCDPTQLMADAKCLTCLEGKQLQVARLQLLCEIKTGIAALAAEIGPLALGPTKEDIAYNATIILDFDGADYQEIALTGDLDLASSINRPAEGYAKTIAVILDTDGSLRNLTFNANWIFVGAAPSDQVASKRGVLSVTATGPAEADVILAYAVEA